MIKTHRRLCILAILLVAAAFRLIGTGWGTPDPQYAASEIIAGRLNPQAVVDPDEFNVVARAYRMVASRQTNPRFFEQPSFYIYLNVAADLISGDTGVYPVNLKLGDLQVAPFTVYVMGRVIAALFSLLGIAFIYAAARQVYGVQVGLLAALIMSMALTDVQYSHYATVNVPGAALVCGGLWASWRLLRTTPRRRDFILAGLLVGLAGSTKYNAGLIGFIYALTGLFVLRRDPSRWRDYLIGYVAVAVGFLAVTPYALLKFGDFWHDFRYITSQYVAGQGYPQTSSAFPLYLAYFSQFVLGPISVVLMIPGVIGAWRGKWKQPRSLQREALLGLGLFLVIYALLTLRGARLGDQLVIPIIGPCAILAACGAVWLWQHLPSPLQSSRILALAGLLVMLAAPLAYSVYFDRQVTLPDTRQQAEAWIYNHIPRGTSVYLLGSYNVPLAPTDYPTAQSFADDQRLLSDIPAAQHANILAVSDSLSYLYNAANVFIPADYAAKRNVYLQKVTAGLPQITSFDRPRWFGDETIIQTVSYFHDPTITLYCLDPTGKSCQD